MRASVLVRIGLVACGAAVALAVGSPAWADTTININPGNVPTTAAGFDSHSCDPNQGGGPFTGQDVWVFVLPGNHSGSGDFVSVVADFGANGTVTITSSADPGNFSNGGPATSKAWVVTPAGWTLTGASAVITGTADFFVLTHTCPAMSSPSPSPSGSPSTSPSPSGSPSSSPSSSVSPSGSTSTSTSPGSSESTGVTPSGGVKAGGGDGTSPAGLAWGLAALSLATGGGVALLIARRRRDNA